VRRHSHDARIESAEAQARAWEQQKADERAARGCTNPQPERAQQPVTDQAIGEMLFAAVALAERAGIDPEQALREANAAFERVVRERGSSPSSGGQGSSSS
jgi:hypothetical protein